MNMDRNRTTVEADGVTLGVEHFGDAAAPLVLLAGGTTMLSWPDALCEALARGGRHVVRYDLRDSGASTTVDPKAPAYTLRDLAADAATLARELDDRPAHLAGIGVGGMVAQVAALDHPNAFSSLTLAGTRPVWAQEHLKGAGERVGVSGVYGDRTVRAVNRFQTSRGLDADGSIGPATWRALLDVKPVSIDWSNKSKARNAKPSVGAGEPRSAPLPDVRDEIPPLSER
jgi:pimeloyl-ACP methyl ester carboxylesterase